MKYKPENVEIIIDKLKTGAYRIEAVAAAAIDYQTFTNWLNEHSEFSDAVKVAELEGKQHFKARYVGIIRNIAENGKSEGYRLGACQWMLERMFSDEFGATIHNKLSGWVDMGETAKQREERKEKLKTFLTEVFIGADVKGKKGDSKEVVKI